MTDRPISGAARFNIQQRSRRQMGAAASVFSGGRSKKKPNSSTSSGDESGSWTSETKKLHLFILHKWTCSGTKRTEFQRQQTCFFFNRLQLVCA